MSVWVRRLVTLACLVAAWLVVRPAAASAPFCDERGASMLAPLPILDSSNASLDASDHGGGCDGGAARDHAYQRGERESRGFSIRVDVLLPAVTVVALSGSPAQAAAPETRDSSPAGVRFLVERPPRA